MVSFINFYFHFLANFQTQPSPRMFSIIAHVMKPVRDINREPGLPVILPRKMYFAKLVNI